MTADGRLIGPTKSQIEAKYLFLVEQPSGSVEIVGYSEFLKRTGQASR